MADISQLPTWAVYVVAFGTPASAFLGVMITGLFGRRSAAEMERRSRREEVMRLMRWSSELAMTPDDRVAQLGVGQLTALADSDLLGDAEKVFVEAALESALSDVFRVAREVEGTGNEVKVLAKTGTPEAPPGGADPSLPLRSTTDEGAAHD